MSFIMMENRVGLRTDPCGTPACSGREEVLVLADITCNLPPLDKLLDVACHVSCQSNCMQFGEKPLVPYRVECTTYV